MELVSKTKIEIFKHNGVTYTRTSDSEKYSWAGGDREGIRAQKLNRILNGGYIHHNKPTHHTKTLGSEELEKLYTQYMRELKLERILKKNKLGTKK